MYFVVRYKHFASLSLRQATIGASAFIAILSVLLIVSVLGLVSTLAADPQLESTQRADD